MGKKTVSLAAIALLGFVGLTGCAADDSNDAPAETSGDNAAESQGMTGEQPAETGGSENADSEGADSGSDNGGAMLDGDLALNLDGAPVDLSGGATTCDESTDQLIVVVHAENRDYSVVMSNEANPTVNTLSLQDEEGKDYGYAEGSNYGSAEVKVDGKSYTVTGEVMLMAPSNSTTVEEVPFEFKVTCP